MAKVKLQITMDSELLERVDTYADDNYMTRSGLISVSVAEYLNARQMWKAITEMSFAMRRIADSGTVDEETMRQLEDFERLAKLLGSGK